MESVSSQKSRRAGHSSSMKRQWFSREQTEVTQLARGMKRREGKVADDGVDSFNKFH